MGCPSVACARVDERPFAAGIAAGASLVMTSTAIYPPLSARPALLSRAVSTELREHPASRACR